MAQIIKNGENYELFIQADTEGNPVTPSGSGVSDTLGFSTFATLANGATYDSGILSLVGYSQVQTHALSDVNGTITVNFLRDVAGTDNLRTLTIPYIGGSGYQMFSAPAFAPYVRYSFTATEVGQTDFYFDTKFLTKGVSPQVLGVDSFVSPQMVSTLSRSVLVGRTRGGESYENVGINPNASMLTSVIEPTTAFGELKVAEATPVIQIDFVYGINTYTTNQLITGSGTIGSASGMAEVSTSANPSSSAVLYSARNLKYRAGQGTMMRFTALFTTGVAGSYQYGGIGFPQLDDGLFFGYNEDDFGTCITVNGVETWTPQTSWNSDTMDGSGGKSNPSGQLLDPTKGNVFQIKYQYLGFGALYFYIEDSETGLLSLVHVIKYANSSILPSLTNPSMPLLWAAKNTTNTTNIVVKGASAFGAVEGKREQLGPRHGFNNSKTTITDSINMFTLKNATTYNGKKNGGLVRLRTIGFGSNTGGTTSGITAIKIVKNATVAGVPSFATTNGTSVDEGVTITNGQSISSVDSAGTLVSNGRVEFNSVVGVGDSGNLDISDLNIYAAPGETLTIAIESTQSCTGGASATWTEDL